MFPVEENDNNDVDTEGLVVTGSRGEWLAERWYEPIVGFFPTNTPQSNFFSELSYKNPADPDAPIFFFKCESQDQKCIIDVFIFPNFAKVRYRGPINIQHLPGSPSFLARARASQNYQDQNLWNYTLNNTTWEAVMKADENDKKFMYEHDNNKRDRIAYNYTMKLEWGDGVGRFSSHINYLRHLVTTLQNDWQMQTTHRAQREILQSSLQNLATEAPKVFLNIFTVTKSATEDKWENMTWNVHPYQNGVNMISTNHSLLRTVINFHWMDEDIFNVEMSPGISPGITRITGITVSYTGPFELAPQSDPDCNSTFSVFPRGFAIPWYRYMPNYGKYGGWSSYP
jgi:hypothetical protein